MFLQLVCTETVKYKRTMIPWLVVCGGFFVSFVAFMMVVSDSQINWEVLIARELSLANNLALLFTAVFSGYVFTNEFHNHLSGTIFTYPVSRLKLYLAKNLVVLLMVVCYYLAFLVLTIFLGVIKMDGLPSTGILLKFIKFIFILSGANFVLVPVTAFISNIVKSPGTYVLTGMSYFLVYVSFFGSDYSLYVPPCIPDSLTFNYFVSEYMSKTDINGMIIVSSMTFLFSFIIDAFCYSRRDV